MRLEGAAELGCIQWNEESSAESTPLLLGVLRLILGKLSSSPTSDKASITQRLDSTPSADIQAWTTQTE